MGCRLIIDKEWGDTVFYDSVTMTAFGPVMKDKETANAFQEWLELDPRRYDDTVLWNKYYEFLKLKEMLES